MIVTIHRGTHQIGGCVTEICTAAARIFIDFGTELPDADGVQPTETLRIIGLTDGKPDCGGVFFTHYHGDHIGNISRIMPGIPIYMGKAAKEISIALNRRLETAHKNHLDSFPDNAKTLEALCKVSTFSAGERVVIGDISVTPYRADHSAFDAYMFLVEAEGKRILHTGDFRNHGYMGEEFNKALKEIGHADVLICEGTMLSRGGDAITEAELSKRARDIFADSKQVFVLCSSTNIDRIRSFYEAKPHSRPAVCDVYQKDILNIAEKFDTTDDHRYSFRWVVPDTSGNCKLHKWMDQKGFVMFVRASDRFREIMETYRDDCKVIYSMWSGYLNQPPIRNFLEGFDYVALHTGGHATRSAVKAAAEAVHPGMVIPIHLEEPDDMKNLLPDTNVIAAEDGVPVEV